MIVDWALAARIQTCDPALDPLRYERRPNRLASQVTNSTTKVAGVWRERSLDLPSIVDEVQKSFTVSAESAERAKAEWSRIGLVLSKTAPSEQPRRVRRYDPGLALDESPSWEEMARLGADKSDQGVRRKVR
jgi:hypothetical protein